MSTVAQPKIWKTKMMPSMSGSCFAPQVLSASPIDTMRITKRYPCHGCGL